MMMSGVVFSFVHAVVLLAISFFILLAVRKLDSQNIKTFGYVIAVLLWVAAALVLGKGVSVRHPMFHRMHMMGEKYPEVSQHVEQAAPTK
ncbi:MAG: hypothetical protein ABSE81_07020 [Candidatus Omnitrophota bacterium]|jgi:hypothetical protein